jgi:uncharacterized membrane protein YfcA
VWLDLLWNIGLVRHGDSAAGNALECKIAMTALLAVGSGCLVGFALSLLGGGGSIFAVPLLIYVVGLRSTHMAIGTSAVAVAVNAFTSLIAHSRAGNVKWPCAATFAAAGVIGAAGGARLGQMVDGQHLLFGFGLVMLVVAAAMFSPHIVRGEPGVRMNRSIALRLVATGLFVGFLAGFFGVGGGFLIMPAIMLGSGMATINAVSSSLVSVGAFGLTTAVTYALAGLVDWNVAGFFILGGIGGGLGGVVLATRLAQRRAFLTRLFAGVVVAVAGFVLWRSARAGFG